MATQELTRLGGALANETRASMLTLIMGGRALTAGELARRVGVAPSTASEHLSVLHQAGLVAVDAQGRHRYFRLSGADVAQILELVAGSAASRDPMAGRPRSALGYARSCYDHLAGTLGVMLHEACAHRSSSSSVTSIRR